jgi:hypothetical protein
LLSAGGTSDDLSVGQVAPSTDRRVHEPGRGARPRPAWAGGHGGRRGRPARPAGRVWAAGGFGYRRDLFTAVEPGALVRSGPFELTLTEATVQHKTSSDDYEVTVLGTARTTGDESISPAVGSGGFVFDTDY